jgi:hypothetical protein
MGSQEENFVIAIFPKERIIPERVSPFSEPYSIFNLFSTLYLALEL